VSINNKLHVSVHKVHQDLYKNIIGKM
jgi:hypothetical protein